MNRRLVGLALGVTLLAGCYGLGAGVRLPPLETGRDFLVGDEPEVEGYGLYSYLLLGSPPANAEGRVRYLSAIAAYLNFVTRREDLEAAHVPRAHLNITYLFLTDSPPAEIVEIRAGGLPADGDLQPAQWVLNHYNYARARAILHQVTGSHPDGPYFLSARAPLSDAQTATGDYLEQDLTHAPPDFTASWVKTFLAQSAAPTEWQTTTLRPAALSLIQTLTTLAAEYPKVQQALGKWITVEG